MYCRVNDQTADGQNLESTFNLLYFHPHRLMITMSQFKALPIGVLHDLESTWMEVGQILQLKADCLNFGPVHNLAIYPEACSAAK